MTLEHVEKLSHRAVAISIGALLDPRPLSLRHLPYANDVGSAYYIFLYLLMQDLQPERVLELGTSSGVGTCHMAIGCATTQVTSIDLHQKMKYVPPNVTLVTGNTLDVHDQFEEESVEVLFIDTEHEPSHMLAEYVKYAPKVKPGGVILFDDIDMGGMFQAWNQIPEPKVTLPLHAHLGFGAHIKCHKPTTDEAAT